MNRRVLLLIFCLLPMTLFSQVYRYTKETRTEYNGKNATDTMYSMVAEVRIEVQITKNHITVMRPPYGSGEPINIEIYNIRKISKGDKQTRITTREDYTVTIYHGQSIALHYKKDNKRIDYSFDNGTNKIFRYEQQLH